MAQDRIENDLLVSGNVSCNTLNVASASITNSMISGSAAIGGEKVIHRYAKHYAQLNGTAATAAEACIHIARASGTIKSIEASVLTAGTSDRVVTVDLKKSTGGGAYASVLTGVITFTEPSTARAISTGSLASASYVDGDQFEIVIALGGSSGNYPQGLSITVIFEEAPA